MLTSLTVDDGSQRQQYFANTLLDIMQQASPGVAEPARGQGTKNDPWILETPREWYWAAKHRTDDHSWFAIGGRLIRVHASGAYANYAADHGPIHHQPGPSSSSGSAAAPSVAGSDVSQRFGEDNGPSYPDIYRKLSSDATLGEAATGQDVAFQIRRLLRGVQEMWAVDSSALPVLTAAFFMGEVRRNHTAFHTGLMLLDLVEAGISYDLTSPEKLNGPVTLSWDKILWHPEVLRSESELESRLSGSTARNSMTLSRQKEANLLMRWLQHALHKYHPALRIEVSASHLKGQVANDEETLSRTSAFALRHAEAPGSAATKKADRNEGFLASARNTKAVLFGSLLQERCDEFYCML